MSERVYTVEGLPTRTYLLSEDGALWELVQDLSPGGPHADALAVIAQETTMPNRYTVRVQVTREETVTVTAENEPEARLKAASGDWEPGPNPGERMSWKAQGEPVQNSGDGSKG